MAIWIGVAVALVLVVGVTTALLLAERQRTTATARSAGARAAAEIERSQVAAESHRREAQGLPSREWTEGSIAVLEPASPRDAPAPPPDRQSFDGRGWLAGSVIPPPGHDAPTHVRVALGPSRSLIGSEHAVSRELELDGAEFRFDDLPLAGYELRVTAPGLQATPRHVLLTRKQARQHLTIQLVPVSWISGRVVDTEGLPIEGLGIVLEHVEDGSRLHAETDGAGSYRFEGVHDGEQRVLVGAATNPLHHAVELVVRAPGLTVPEIELPALGALEVTVEDAGRTRVAGATLRGWGSAGGVVEGETDTSGRALIRHLPPGQYKIAATLAGVGSGWARVELEAGRTERATIAIRNTP